MCPWASVELQSYSFVVRILCFTIPKVCFNANMIPFAIILELSSFLGILKDCKHDMHVNMRETLFIPHHRTKFPYWAMTAFILF